MLELTPLLLTAAAIGFFHTLLGPDHYLPFIMMARARKWSLIKTSVITFLCGLGHIGSSVILGLIGIALGIAVSKISNIEDFRGNLAAWLLITFGIVYFVWGLKQTQRNKSHKHSHSHRFNNVHHHTHIHNKEHLHVHDNQTNSKSITPWILFTIFLFGPCEPLIPILMYPAAQNSLFGLITVTTIFGIVTISTMMGMVLISSFCIKIIPLLKHLEKYTHALAGAAILVCGIAIKFGL